MARWYHRARAEIEARNLKQNDIAARMGLTPGRLNHYLTGKREPSFDQVRALAGELGMSVAELAGEDVYLLIKKNEQDAMDEFRELGPDKQAAVIEMMRALAKTEKPDRKG